MPSVSDVLRATADEIGRMADDLESLQDATFPLLSPGAAGTRTMMALQDLDRLTQTARAIGAGMRRLLDRSPDAALSEQEELGALLQGFDLRSLQDRIAARCPGDLPAG